MNLKFTIGRRIGFGFGILILLTLGNFVLTIHTLFKSRHLSDQILTVYTPSVDALEDLHVLVLSSQKMMNFWVHVQSSDDHPDKQKLKVLINDSYPLLKKRLNWLSLNWSFEDRHHLSLILKDLDILFTEYKSVMKQLNTFASYEDASVVFMVRPEIEGGTLDQLTKNIMSSLSALTASQHVKTQMVSNQMISSFSILEYVVIGSAWVLLVGGIVIAFFTVRSIVTPVKKLQGVIKDMGKGVLPKDSIAHHNDEIGDMALALNLLVDGMKRTAEFSRQVGAGIFDKDYKPLSKDDMLGNSLLLMRSELKELTGDLEAKVAERTQEIERQSLEIEQSNKTLQTLFTAQTDSIVYAKRIQESILPSESYIRHFLQDFFVFYRPRHIISGDFYWFEQHDNILYLAAVDCTGHGVPGALMSIIGHDLLDSAIRQKNIVNAGQVLDHLNRELARILRIGEEGSGGSKDGMDIALCRIDLNNMEMQYAGAYNPLYLFRDGVLQEFKADKRPIGFFADDKTFVYSTLVIPLKSGDMFYIFSDGYADQFGGPDGKKFMYRNFKTLLLNIHQKRMEEQEKELRSSIDLWMGTEEQIDDLMVIGFRIP